MKKTLKNEICGMKGSGALRNKKAQAISITGAAVPQRGVPAPSQSSPLAQLLPAQLGLDGHDCSTQPVPTP